MACIGLDENQSVLLKTPIRESVLGSRRWRRSSGARSVGGGVLTGYGRRRDSSRRGRASRLGPE